MSASPFPQPGALLRRWFAPPPGSPLYVPWLALAGFCTGLMWAFPGDETIPYHVAWTGFALAFGSRVWSRTRTILALLAFTVITGGILVLRVYEGVLAWQETAEIPLMSVIMLLLVWSVRRRQDALAIVTGLAQREQERARDEEMLTRLTSHEMRSPLTIATGYVELLRQQEVDPQKVRDLDIVHDELTRLTRTTERLILVIRLQNEPVRETVDLHAILADSVARWSRVTPRHWVVDSGAGHLHGSPERLRVCLDTLIENALRYTTEADTIRVFAHWTSDTVHIGVADSGPGMADDQIDSINRFGGCEGFSDPLSPDSPGQSGLGLGIVRSVAASRGGRLTAARAPEGGAQVSFFVPLEIARQVRTQPTAHALSPAAVPLTG